MIQRTPSLDDRPPPSRRIPLFAWLPVPLLILYLAADAISLARDSDHFEYDILLFTWSVLFGLQVLIVFGIGLKNLADRVGPIRRLMPVLGMCAVAGGSLFALWIALEELLEPDHLAPQTLPVMMLFFGGILLFGLSVSL